MTRLAISLVVCLLFSGAASGAVLDWGSVNWAPNGALTESFLTGIDQIDFAVTGATTRFITENGSGTLTPNDVDYLDGGLNPDQQNLNLSLDLMLTTESIVVTITFPNAASASNISFTIFDIDRSTTAANYRDRVRVRADSDTIVPTTVTGSANNTVSASGLGGIGGNDTVTGDTSTADEGAGSGDANATFTLAGPITSVTITYLNISGATTQWIGIHDITFTPNPAPVPEPASLVLSGIAAGGGWLMFRRRKRAGSEANPQAMSAATP